ncbi:MAG: hypothetical protein ACJAS1_001636 [Oleiphilaceae bacterium]|jgi:hypothetical protein
MKAQSNNIKTLPVEPLTYRQVFKLMRETFNTQSDELAYSCEQLLDHVMIDYTIADEYKFAVLDFLPREATEESLFSGKEIYMAIYQARKHSNDNDRAALERDIEVIWADGRLPMIMTSSTVACAIHPSTKVQGKIQVTRYLESGIFGDSLYNSIEDAIRKEPLESSKLLSAEDAEKFITTSLMAESSYQHNLIEYQKVNPGMYT